MEFIWQLKGSLHYTISALWVYSVDGLGEIPSLTDGGHFTADYNKIVSTHTHRSSEQQIREEHAGEVIRQMCRNSCNATLQIRAFWSKSVESQEQQKRSKKKSTQQMFNGLALTDNNILISTKNIFFPVQTIQAPNQVQHIGAISACQRDSTQQSGVACHDTTQLCASSQLVLSGERGFISSLKCSALLGKFISRDCVGNAVSELAMWLG